MKTGTLKAQGAKAGAWNKTISARLI